LAALEVADTKVELPLVSAFAHPNNEASQKLLQKVGFQPERHVESMNRILYRRRRPALLNEAHSGYQKRAFSAPGSTMTSEFALRGGASRLKGKCGKRSFFRFPRRYYAASKCSWRRPGWLSIHGGRRTG
jgi:hypothetical protein